MFVFRDNVARGEKFFAEEWPSVRAIADLTGEWWQTFSIRQVGTPMSLFGPSMFAAAARALFKGNFVARPGSAPLTEPGAFLLSEKGVVLKQHVFDHIGDHPDFAAFARL